jgi:prepilin-type N-terminal cleavage/methylation domain-containing protein
MTKKGFTLVELMVVVGILSIIMLVISQPVSSVIKYQRESQTTDSLRDNLQFVINKMEKELKTSANVYVDDSGALRFKDQNGGFVTYSFDNTNGVNGVMQRNGSAFTDASVFTVERLNFIVTDKPNLAKLVTVSIAAKSVDGKDSVSMQTSVLPVNDKPVIKDGLMVHLDAGNRNSYSSTTPTQWKDISGNNKNLTLSGNPTKSNNDSGYIQFDNNNDYGSSNGNVGIDLSQGISIGMWFKSSDLETREQGLILYQGIADTQFINFWIDSNGKLRWETITSAISPTNFIGSRIYSQKLDNNTWYYVVGTYKSDGIQASSNLYINGVPAANANFTSPNYPSNYNVPIRIGEYPNFGKLSGNISQVLIYNRALTSSEVEYNYNVTKGRFGIQ